MIEIIPPPTLTTARLTLRPPALTDLPDLQRLIGDPDIASTTLRIPHPYFEHHATEWFAGLPERLAKREAVNFSMVITATREYIGGLGIHPKPEHDRAEIGYWIGKPYWRQGYCTEALRAAIDYSFQTLQLNRVEAHHFARNPASGRVMQKAGMRYEGHLRQHLRKEDGFEDAVLYAILRSDLAAPAACSHDPRDPWML